MDLGIVGYVTQNSDNNIRVGMGIGLIFPLVLLIMLFILCKGEEYVGIASYSLISVEVEFLILTSIDSFSTEFILSRWNASPCTRMVSTFHLLFHQSKWFHLQ